jgi:hypothetical protein
LKNYENQEKEGLDLCGRLESAQYNREGIDSNLFPEVERHVDKVKVLVLKQYTGRINATK